MMQLTALIEVSRLSSSVIIMLKNVAVSAELRSFAAAVVK
jgi:hypothetical protein